MSSHTHTHPHTHTILLFTPRLCSVPVPFFLLSLSHSLRCALCPLSSVPCSVPGFCTCPGNIYRHFFLPLFLGEFSSPPAAFWLSHIRTPVHSSSFFSSSFLFFVFVFLSVFAKCCQMFAVFPVVYFEGQSNLAGLLIGYIRMGNCDTALAATA